MTMVHKTLPSMMFLLNLHPLGLQGMQNHQSRQSTGDKIKPDKVPTVRQTGGQSIKWTISEVFFFLHILVRDLRPKWAPVCRTMRYCLLKDGSRYWGLFAHFFMQLLGQKGLTMRKYGSFFKVRECCKQAEWPLFAHPTVRTYPYTGKNLPI